MSDLLYYLRHNTVRDESWWAFRVVAWYCLNRGVRLPKGRCHFGEIVILFVPAYVFLGLLFRAAKSLGRISKYPTMPVWLPTLWFGRRLPKEFERDRYRGVFILILAGLFDITVLLVTWAYDAVSEANPAQ